jgi:hypothetical protein
MNAKPAQAVDPDQLRALVREEIRAILGAALAEKPATYSDRKGHGPAGYSDEVSKEKIRACPYSVKRGRWLVVDREAFEGWERSQLPAAPAPVKAAPAPWSPASALEAAGLRRQG